MKVIEKTNRTTEEAIEEALTELGVEASQVDIEVLDEGSKGIFGFLGGRSARVRVSYRQAPEDVGRRFLQDFLRAAGFKSEVQPGTRDGHTVLEVSGDDLGALIGRHGQALDALQYLTNVVANRHAEEKQRLIVDAEGYRRRREESLRKLAARMAEKVRREQRKTILEPMTAQERRIIHSTLQDVGDVFTYSEGEEPYRRVVISPENRS